MSKGGVLATAFVTHDNVLVGADEPLATMQRQGGGSIPGPLAIPSLAALVARVFALQLPLSRGFEASLDTKRVGGWVDLSPMTDDEIDGCLIELTDWRELADLDASPVEGGWERDDEIDRFAAEGHGVLDAQQRMLGFRADAPDLASLESQTAIGVRWTDLVVLEGDVGSDAPHWRLLDGVLCSVPGSERSWIARLMPLGGDPEAGFEWALVPATAEPAMDGQVDACAPVIDPGVRPQLRKPIQRIIANAETISARLAGPLGDEYRDYARDIATAGAHLLSLIDDLADCDVIEADGFATAPDPIDLVEIARQAASILSMKAGRKAIAIEFDDRMTRLPAVGEFRRVLQILLNLLGNAIAYSPEETAILVSFAEADGRAEITITDRGPGIPVDRRDAVFEKYERLGRQGDGGSGLGLYISRRLARAMGGDLALTDGQEQGANFTLTLPREARKP